ncbi:MAG: DMT family transporter [Deltaproteobacteria bacterium]
MTERRRQLAGVLMVAGAAAGWGTWSLFLLPTGLPAVVTTPIMFLVMAVAGIPLMLREPAPRWDRRALWLLAGNTAFDLINVLTFFSAMNHTTVAIAVLTHYAAPIIIALAAPWIDGTTARGTRPAAAVALTGLLIVLEPWHSPAAGALVGAALGLASAVCYAGNVFTVRRLAAQVGAARAIVTHSFLAAVITLPFAVPYLSRVTATDLGYLVAGSITIGTGSGVLFVVGLGRIGSARAAVLTFAEPLVAVCVGALAWAQPLGAIAALGGALVLAAGIHVSRQAR